jgi:hypothetical protein
VIRLSGFALLSGLLMASASCGSDGAKPVPPGHQAPESQGSLDLETLVQQSIPGQGGQTVREVIRDQAAWTAMWAKLREGSSLPETPPAVDFTKDMVIVAAMETQPCVSKVTVRSAVESGGELVVGILEAPPAPNCVCFTAERPIHVVRLRKVDGPARFDVERGQTPC